MRFCSQEFLESSLRIYTKFANFFIIAQKFQLELLLKRFFQRSFGKFLKEFEIFRILACHHFGKISSHEYNFCQLTFVWSGRAFQRKHCSKPHQSLNPKFLNICVYGYNRNSSKSDWAIHLTKSPNLVCFYLFCVIGYYKIWVILAIFVILAPPKWPKNEILTFCTDFVWLSPPKR